MKMNMKMRDRVVLYVFLAIGAAALLSGCLRL